MKRKPSRSNLCKRSAKSLYINCARSTTIAHQTRALILGGWPGGLTTESTCPSLDRAGARSKTRTCNHRDLTRSRTRSEPDRAMLSTSPGTHSGSGNDRESLSETSGQCSTPTTTAPQPLLAHTLVRPSNRSQTFTLSRTLKTSTTACTMRSGRAETLTRRHTRMLEPPLSHVESTP